jgi:type IV pilus assembly protein PilA
MKTAVQRSTDESGFTLIELLVVILVIGILAAIAVPAFLSQTSKASDSAAKTQVETLQTAMETCANENGGNFSPCTQAELERVEPTLKDTATAKVVWANLKGTATGYEVESEAAGSKHTYKLANNNGAISRTCKPSGTGGCSATSSW